MDWEVTMDYKLYKSEVLEGKEIDSVVIDTFVDNPRGMELVEVTIHFKDGNFKILTHEREL